MYIFGLTDSMAAILCLSIHCRIPIGIVENHRIRTCEVHTDTAGARGQDKDEDLLVAVEPLHEHLPLDDLRGAIESNVGVAVVVQEQLQNIEHLGHLCEDQAAMLFTLETREEKVERLQLSAIVLNQSSFGELQEHVLLNLVDRRENFEVERR